MNGVDPSPQDVSLQDSLFSGHQSQSVPLQPAGHRHAHRNRSHPGPGIGIPVVGVYETMPAPGYDYQTWMLAEITALHKAVADRISTQKL